MKNLFKCLIIFLFSMTLFACGGGSSGTSSSGTGTATTSSSPATISTDNERSLGIAATEGAKAAVSSGNAPFRGTAGRAGLNQVVQDHANKLLARLIDVSEFVCTDGGTASSDISDDGTVINTTYGNCSFGGGVINGVVSITSAVNGDTTTTRIEYKNVTYTTGGSTRTLNQTAVCTTTGASSSCSYNSDVTGIDGRSYSVSGSTVTGSSSSGYTVSSTITDPDYGTFSIETTSPILFNCTNGQPSSGEIRFTDSASVVATVTFNDCASFTIAYNGTSTVYNW